MTLLPAVSTAIEHGGAFISPNMAGFVNCAHLLGCQKGAR